MYEDDGQKFERVISAPSQQRVRRLLQGADVIFSPCPK